MEQDSINVTAKFKATVELLVDLHATQITTLNV